MENKNKSKNKNVSEYEPCAHDLWMETCSIFP